MPDITAVQEWLRRHPVVGIIGARQVGKTTRVGQTAETAQGPVAFFDLESDEDLARLSDPLLALRPLRGLAVPDEIQRRPDLFRTLRVLADRPGAPCRFLILGSAAPALLRQSAESLAGRIACHTLGGFTLGEVGPGAADTTVRHYLDLLTSALVIHQPPPWHANVAKRRIKAPKIHIGDSGLPHCPLGLPPRRDLEAHPKLGASRENFIISQLIARLRGEPEECFFRGTHGGAELDLLVARGRRRMGYEVKRTSSPPVTPAMRSALRDLDLESLVVVHAGQETFPLTDRIRAVAADRIPRGIPPPA